MSLHPQTNFDIPKQTRKIARLAFPHGNRYMHMRDELGPIYTDALFAHLYPKRGQPAHAPWRLALVTLMQFCENLTDRQAADAVRARIDWKYALSLELDDPGFDFSVLTAFRRRLLEGGSERLLFGQMLEVFKTKDLLRSGGQQRSDSTHILGAVRRLNRVEIVGQTLHHALNQLAQLDPAWLRAVLEQVDPTAWFAFYGRRFSDFRLPRTKAKRLEMAHRIGCDGQFLLTALFAPSTPVYLKHVPAVDLLRRVWMQHYYVENNTLTWRDKDNVPPAALRIVSPYDPEVRYSEKHHMNWYGYKVHLSEHCTPDQPHIITHVETTPATDPDVVAVESIHQGLAEQGLCPDQHLLDGAYISSNLLVRSEQDYGIDLVGPVRVDRSWQALDETAFDVSQFSLDWAAQTAYCPQGKPSRYWHAAHSSSGQPTIQVQFDPADCLACSARARCTRSAQRPRQLTLHPQAQQMALQAARQRQQRPSYKKTYAKRAGIEGTISEAVCALGMRRTRYRGLAKTHLHHLMTATAINLNRVLRWINGEERAQTYQSHFARLAPT